MTDRELLEASAKVSGYVLTYRRGSDAFYYDDPDTGREEWHPLSNDGQALRLAVDLRLTVLESSVRSKDGQRVFNVFPGQAPDRYAATRRAIVLAAAALATQKD